jgi:uncharacterized membrane protein YwaF
MQIYIYINAKPFGGGYLNLDTRCAWIFFCVKKHNNISCAILYYIYSNLERGKKKKKKRKKEKKRGGRPDIKL